MLRISLLLFFCAGYEDLSETARERLKIRVLGSPGCAMGGLEDETVQILRRYSDLLRRRRAAAYQKSEEGRTQTGAFVRSSGRAVTSPHGGPSLASQPETRIFP